MLFWAGLRGAVGVALANGFQGENAAALRTTVLVVVVLTVIMFGGTTARMLEVMGIKVGVEEEGSSSDEEGVVNVGRRQDGPWLGSHLENGVASPWTGRAEVYGWDRPPTAPIGQFRGRRTPVRTPSAFSAGSDESYSDGGEVLPMSTSAVQASGSQHIQGDNSGSRTPGLGTGEWSFTALDERYLLPLFSNSVASRSFNARKAGRRAAMGLPPDGVSSREDSGGEEVDSGDEVGHQAARRGGDFAGSVGNFFGLRGGPNGSSPPGSPIQRDPGRRSGSK